MNGRLTKSEVALLQELVSHRRQVVPHRALGVALGYEDFDAAVDLVVRQHIKDLRKKVGRAVIRTKRSWGYQWAGRDES